MAKKQAAGSSGELDAQLEDLEFNAQGSILKLDERVLALEEQLKKLKVDFDQLALEHDAVRTRLNV